MRAQPAPAAWEAADGRALAGASRELSRRVAADNLMCTAVALHGLRVRKLHVLRVLFEAWVGAIFWPLR